MSIHIADVVLQARGFNDDVDVSKPLHKMSQKFDFTLLILINDAGVARLTGLEGGMSHKHRIELANQLKKRGVLTVEWRHGDRSRSLQLGNNDEL